MSLSMVVQGARVLMAAGVAVECIKNFFLSMVQTPVPSYDKPTHAYDEAMQKIEQDIIDKGKLPPKDPAELEKILVENHRQQFNAYVGKTLVFAYGATALASGQYLPGSGVACAYATYETASDLAKLLKKT